VTLHEGPSTSHFLTSSAAMFLSSPSEEG